MVCELIFNICKCTAPETRHFVASQLPLLMWTEWVLDREDPGLEEDLSAIEVALLAAFQQDLNIQSQTPFIRVPDIKRPSIYHRPSIEKVDEKSAARFPYNSGSKTVIDLDPAMYPMRPITKIDEYTRPIVLYRLCRFLQDNLYGLPTITKVAYCVLIERLAVKATNLGSEEVALCLRTLKIGDPVGNIVLDTSSALSVVGHDHEGYQISDNSSLPSPVETIADDMHWLVDIFFETPKESIERRFQPILSLYLLWADSLATFGFQFPTLAKLVRRQLLRRAKAELVPLAVLALS